ncbi:hypothetical protein Tco_0190850 [Tanacetum coccineum]
MGLWYPKDSGFDLKQLLQMLIAGMSMTTRESNSGSAQFLGHGLLGCHPKSRMYLPSPLLWLEYSALSGCLLQCSNSLVRVLNLGSLDLRFNKIPMFG